MINLGRVAYRQRLSARIVLVQVLARCPLSPWQRRHAARLAAMTTYVLLLQPLPHVFRPNKVQVLVADVIRLAVVVSSRRVLRRIRTRRAMRRGLAIKQVRVGVIYKVEAGVVVRARSDVGARYRTRRAL